MGYKPKKGGIMFLVQEIFYLILGMIFNFGGVHHSTEPRVINPHQGTIQTQGDPGGKPLLPDP